MGPYRSNEVVVLTEKDLEEMESMVGDSPDAAQRQREIIERLIAEVRRLMRKGPEEVPATRLSEKGA